MCSCPRWSHILRCHSRCHCHFSWCGDSGLVDACPGFSLDGSRPWSLSCYPFSWNLCPSPLRLVGDLWLLVVSSPLDICKTMAQIKKFKNYDPPKSEVSKAKLGFWGSKKFSGTPKTRKIDFLIKPKLCNLTEHGGSSHNGPGHLGALRPQYLIQKVATLL